MQNNVKPIIFNAVSKQNAQTQNNPQTKQLPCLLNTEICF